MATIKELKELALHSVLRHCSENLHRRALPTMALRGEIANDV